MEKNEKNSQNIHTYLCTGQEIWLKFLGVEGGVSMRNGRSRGGETGRNRTH